MSTLREIFVDGESFGIVLMSDDEAQALLDRVKELDRKYEDVLEPGDMEIKALEPSSHALADVEQWIAEVIEDGEKEHAYYRAREARGE